MKSSADRKKKPLSLRTSITIILILAAVLFSSLFIVILRFVSANVLERAEFDYLTEQKDNINALFEQFRFHTDAMNREIALWNEMVQYVRGDDPDFIKRNWSDGDPARVFRINYFIIKDNNCDDVYKSSYDYINNKPLPFNESLSAFLKPYCRSIIREHISRVYGNTHSEIKNSGVVFFQSTPYYVSITPITPFMGSADIAGSLIFVTLLNQDYFQDLANLKNTGFTLTSRRSFDSDPVKLDKSRAFISLPLLDFQGNPAFLSVETVRFSIPNEKINGNTISAFIIGFIIFVCALYFILDRLFIIPVNRLHIAIQDMNPRKRLDKKEYPANMEFLALIDSINIMLEKIQRSSIPTASFQKILNEMGSALIVVNIETFDLLFVNDAMKNELNIDSIQPDQKCWTLCQNDRVHPCSFCSLPALLKEPEKPIVWEEFSNILGEWYKVTSSLIEWEGRQAMLQHKVNITELKNVESILTKRLKQQELLTAISNSFLSLENMNVLIENALMQAGSYMNVSKMVLAQYDGDKLKFLYEWYNPEQDIPRLPENRTNYFGPGEISYTIFSDQGKSELLIDDTASLEELHNLYEPLHIRALLAVPVIIYGKMWGFLSIDECKTPRSWDSNDSQFLRLIANSLSALIVKNKAEQEALDAKRAAEESSKVKGFFLARMSHEMRTPLNAIIGNTSIIQSSQGNMEKIVLHLSKIKEASLHLRNVIDDLLDMSNIERGKFQLSPSPFSLERMIRNVVHKVKFSINNKKQNFFVTIDKKLPFEIIADEPRFAQVFMNILSNASKFTPFSGNISLSIEKIEKIEGEIEDKSFCTLRAAVSDTGIGISKEQQKNLFILFEQADGGATRRYGGTGVGLAISKTIIEMMGGKIWVESSLGKGTVFSFEVTVQCGKVKNPDAPVSFKKARILAVDDSSIIREYFTGFAEANHIQCTAADSGKEAYALIENAVKHPDSENGNFDIIFIDWYMPEMNGFELARKIRQLKPDAVIIVVSAGEWELIRNEAQKAGVDGFIAKPLFASVIIDCINAHLLKKSKKPKEWLTELNGEEESGEENNVENIFAGKNILLAEDIEINQEIVTGLLEPTGVSIDCAINGVEAVEKFQQNSKKYDLILMDIHMPEMDGFDAARNIRRLEAGTAPNIPIIALTANVFKEDIEKCRMCGMDDHLGKPIDFELMLAKLKKYLLPV